VLSSSAVFEVLSSSMLPLYLVAFSFFTAKSEYDCILFNNYSPFFHSSGVLMLHCSEQQWTTRCATS